MRRYWVAKDSIENSQVIFTGETFHHIFDVCRQEVGSYFEVLTGDQKAHLVEIVSVEKKKALGKIKEVREIPPLPRPHLHLALSIPRYHVMDAVVERAVELGVHSLHPFFSDHSFIRKSSSLPAGKAERWHKIVISATQQSGRGDLMRVLPAIGREEILQEFNRQRDRLGLFAYEGQAQKSIREYLLQQRSMGAQEIWLFVGSEGGFSAEEVKSFQALGLESVSLGEQVLRVETACLALISVLKYDFGLMK